MTELSKNGRDSKMRDFVIEEEFKDEAKDGPNAKNEKDMRDFLLDDDIIMEGKPPMKNFNTHKALNDFSDFADNSQSGITHGIPVGDEQKYHTTSTSGKFANKINLTNAKRIMNKKKKKVNEKIDQVDEEPASPDLNRKN